METKRQPLLSSGWCYASNLESPRDSIAPKLSGAPGCALGEWWEHGLDSCHVPMPHYSSFRKSFLANCGHGETGEQGNWGSFPGVVIPISVLITMEREVTECWLSYGLHSEAENTSSGNWHSGCRSRWVCLESPEE